MFKKFATPSILQRYVVDPITYRLTSYLEKNYPDLTIIEGLDSITFSRDDEVINALSKIMESYKSFRYRNEGDSHFWYMPISPSSNYTGGLLKISLISKEGFYKFTTCIQLGKKKKVSYAMTKFGFITILSIVGLAVFLMSYLQQTLTIPQFATRAVICIVIGLISGFLEMKVNPTFKSSKKKEKKSPERINKSK